MYIRSNVPHKSERTKDVKEEGEDADEEREKQQPIDKRNPFLWLMAYIRFSIFSLIKLKRMGNNNETKRIRKQSR